jgi:hypothetical protein
VKNIFLLEDDDVPLETDWMRPLWLSYQPDGFSENSECGGGPLNNFKWARVSETIGECWYGRTVYNLQKILAKRYEFVRGEVPDEHQWNR